MTLYEVLREGSEKKSYLQKVRILLVPPAKLVRQHGEGKEDQSICQLYCK